MQNFPGLPKFHAPGDKRAQFEADTVGALVEDEEQTETMVVEYKKGTRIVKNLQEL